MPLSGFHSVSLSPLTCVSPVSVRSPSFAFPISIVPPPGFCLDPHSAGMGISSPLGHTVLKRPTAGPARSQDGAGRGKAGPEAGRAGQEPGKPEPGAPSPPRSGGREAGVKSA